MTFRQTSPHIRSARFLNILIIRQFTKYFTREVYLFLLNVHIISHIIYPCRPRLAEGIKPILSRKSVHCILFLRDITHDTASDFVEFCHLWNRLISRNCDENVKTWRIQNNVFPISGLIECLMTGALTPMVRCSCSRCDFMYDHYYWLNYTCVAYTSISRYYLRHLLEQSFTP